MNKKHFFPAGMIGFVLSAALLPAMIGCVGGSGRGVVQVQSEGMVEDDYVYYPGYEVYYSSNRHQYMYRDGRNWVTRATPPRVAVNVLQASPSVRVDFHDSPAQHHDAVVKSYPKNWKPAGNPAVRNESPKTERKDDKNNRNDNPKHENEDADQRRS